VEPGIRDMPAAVATEQKTPWWAWVGLIAVAALALSQWALASRIAQMSTMLSPHPAIARGARTTDLDIPGIARALADIRSELSTVGRDLMSSRRASESDHQSAFAILREEISRKSKELEDAQLGNDFRSKRPTLIALARAFDIIWQDQQSQGVPAESTLNGVASELREALEDHGITQLINPPGIPLDQATGIDVKNSTRSVPTSDDDRGKILDTIRPAYVLREGDTVKEILIPSLVRYFA
jgi:hypothetical protein